MADSAMRLKDKVAIVTGAGSGNGHGIALRFAQEGCAVACVDVNEDATLQTAAQIVEAGQQSVAVRADISRRDEVHAMVACVMERFGRVDILVNNAGVEFLTHLLDITEEEWDRTLNINLKGTFLCTQAVAREMVRLGVRGRIVNIASICSEVALEHQVHYCASKGGVRMMTKAMALDLAEAGITVNAIGPGVIETAMTRRSLDDPDRRAMLLRRIPLGRIGQPEDVAAGAVFLASDDASYITGATLFIDGGWLIR